METYEHTEHEHTEQELAENEPAEDEHEEDGEDEPSEDEDGEDETSETERTESEAADYDHTEYEPAEYGEHTEFHIDEFRMSAAGALLRNQVLGGRFRIVQAGAKTEEVLGVTRARVQEKLSQAGSLLEYGIFSFTHPFHPLRRMAARDARREQKKLASDKRRQRVGAIKSHAAGKIAKAREGRIAILEEGVNED